MTVDVKNKEVTITSQYDNVNTTLACTDNMLQTLDFDAYGHQVYVNKGTTTITFYYPYLLQGIAISAVALLASIILLWIVKKREKQNSIEKV